MTLIFDAGGLLELERGHPDIVRLVQAEIADGRTPRTHGGVIGQVWRGGSGRQALLARHLRGIEVVPLDEELGKAAGVLLGRTRTRDVVDAAVVLLATRNDYILTSDPGDLRPLVQAVGVRIGIRSI